MEQEQDRLQRMYDDMSDEQLQALSGAPDSLTDAARLALRKVMEARGLVARRNGQAQPVAASAPANGDLQPTPEREHEEGFTPGIPGVFPSGAAAVEKALEPGGDMRDGMISLVTFFDGHELTQACATLDEAELDFAIENVDGEALSGAPPSFTLWVDPLDKSAAEQVLRERLGLFPVAENGDEPEYDDEPMTLGSFETPAEAERVRALLTEAGISSQVETEDIDGKSWTDVTVKGTELERGLQVVSAGLHIN